MGKSFLLRSGRNSHLVQQHGTSSTILDPSNQQRLLRVASVQFLAIRKMTTLRLRTKSRSQKSCQRTKHQACIGHTVPAPTWSVMERFKPLRGRSLRGMKNQVKALNIREPGGCLLFLCFLVVTLQNDFTTGACSDRPPFCRANKIGKLLRKVPFPSCASTTAPIC